MSQQKEDKPFIDGLVNALGTFSKEQLHGGQAAPQPETRVTLLDRETYLQALMESEGTVPAELEAEFKADVEAALKTTKAKRDRVSGILFAMTREAAMCDGAIEAHTGEIDRLQARANRFRSAAARLSDYVLGVIREIGHDEKGKWKPLEGNTSTLKAAKCPASVEITNPAAIPDNCCTFQVTLTAEQYALFLSGRAEWEAMANRVVVRAPSKTIIKGRLEAVALGVPGARLVTDKLRLVVS